MQLNQEKMLNKEPLPDLQLRLSQRVGKEDKEAHGNGKGKGTNEISTKLSLS
jgi:hypothetical protein